MATPEGKVKDALKKGFAKIGILSFTEAVAMLEKDQGFFGYYFMAASNGMGEAGVSDFVLCIMGRYIEVEAKAKGGTQSAIQKLHMNVIHNADGEYYIVEGEDEAKEFLEFISDMVLKMDNLNNVKKALGEVFNQEPSIPKEMVN